MADNTTKIVLTAEDRTQGAFQSVERGLGGMQRQALAAASALSAIGFTAAAASAVAFVRSIANAADDMAKLSQRVGISVRDLAQWQLAADLSGASIESVTKGVKGLATFLKEHGDRLKAVGITTNDASTAMMQLADIFAAMPDGLQKTALATELFGKAGLDMIPMLNSGSKGLEELRAKADEYGKSMAEIAPESERFNDALTELGLQSKIAGANLAKYLLPGLSGMAQWFNDAAAGGKRAEQALKFLEDSNSPLMRGAAALHRFFKPDEFAPNGWAMAGMDPVSGRTLGTAASSGAASPWGSDAEFMARMQANILLGPRAGAKAAKAAGVTGSVADYASQIQMAVGKAISDADIVKAREFADQLAALDSLFFDSGLDAEIYAGALDKLAKMKDSTAESTKRLAEQEADAQKLIAMTSAGQINALVSQQDLAAQLLASGRIDFTGYDQILDKLGGIKEAGKDMFSDLGRVVDGWGKSAAGVFAEWATGAEISIDKVGAAMAREFVQQQSYQRFFKPLFDAGGSWLDNVFGTSPNALGGVYDAPGLHAYANQVVDRPTVFPFARGAGLMGEAGPEAIMPLSRGADGKLGVKAQGGGGVVVNVVEAPGQGGQTRQRQEGGLTIVDVMVDRVRSALANDITRGTGPVPGALAGAYGLNRVAGAY